MEQIQDFLDQISVHIEPKCTEILSEKNPYMGQSDPLWTQICQPSPASQVHVCAINDVFDTSGTIIDDIKVCSLILLPEMLKIHGSIHFT